jgi:hypothetical protein
MCRAAAPAHSLRCRVLQSLSSGQRIAVAEKLPKVSVQQFVDTVIYDKSFLNGALSAAGSSSAPLQHP